MMATPAETPQKKRQPPLAGETSRRVSGALTAESKAQAAAALGLGSSNNSLDAPNSTAKASGAMLPTPAKTPRKPSSAKNEAEIRAVARNLFMPMLSTDVVYDDEAAGEPSSAAFPDAKKRKPKKYTGLSLQSFTAVEVDEPIQIYTDSHERIPEVDNSADNPFLGSNVVVHEPAVPQLVKRGRSKKVAVPGEGRQTIEEAVRREDGLVYVL
jgi:hypothetical protein